LRAELDEHAWAAQFEFPPWKGTDAEVLPTIRLIGLSHCMSSAGGHPNGERKTETKYVGQQLGWIYGITEAVFLLINLILISGVA
jgi:hypothetical protein